MNYLQVIWLTVCGKQFLTHILINFMIGLFLFGTLWFWLLIGIEIIIIISSLEQDKVNSLGWLSFLVVLGILYFCGNAHHFNDFFQYTIQHPIVSVLFFLGYLIAGTVWSFVKWYVYLKKKATKYVINQSDNSYIWDTDFKAKSQKQRILNWMMYWPFSLVWTVIDQPFKKAFLYIYNSIENKYQSIGDNILKDVKDKRKKPTEGTKSK